MAKNLTQGVSGTRLSVQGPPESLRCHVNVNCYSSNRHLRWVLNHEANSHYHLASC
jgi:hypothetical protein